MDVRLIYFGTSGRKREVRLNKGVVAMGRGEQCQLRIPADTVSRRHCELEVTPTAVILSDLGSSNGTKVNGKSLIDDDLELKAGDKITVGPATFIVVIDGKPANVGAPEPVAPDGEEALTGSSVAEEAFDPFSALNEVAEEEEEEEEDIPAGPRIAQIRPDPKKGAGPDAPKGPPGAAQAKKEPEKKPEPKKK